MQTSERSTGRLSERILVELAEPYLDNLRARNQMIWSNPRRWKLGFYFGADDTRLWVPRRCRCGAPREDDRVLNFGHPRGKQAFRILLMAYFTGALLLAALLAAALGMRW
jgi:uncharacterized membrane protein